MIPTGLRGALMVCGTTSNAGKSTMVAGLCRLLNKEGIKVAPFKAQNMALNSAVTCSGHEIGRAQYLQAQAAGVTPQVTMNPVLLKPTGERTSQVVVMGKPVGVMSAAEYHNYKPQLFDLVAESLAELRRQFDVVLIEGAGSPAELNLLPHDIVNLRLAERSDVDAIVVGDIDPGGVFASLYGTVMVLPDNLRARVKGFVINKLRGDPALLLDGTDQLENLCEVPTVGVVPMLEDLHLDGEDSLNVHRPPTEHSHLQRPPTIDVAVIELPHLSNFTDVDPLHAEPSVAIRYVRSVGELGRPHLVIIPGSKATVEDLRWLQQQGFGDEISGLANDGVTILGICGGYQMLGDSITDTDNVETSTSADVIVTGLGLLPVSTTFHPTKTLASISGRSFSSPITGYQIHHGVVRRHDIGGSDFTDQSSSWMSITDTTGTVSDEGCRLGSVFGTTVHGLFESDEFRTHFLQLVAKQAGVSFVGGEFIFSELRDQQLDRLANHLTAHLDLSTISQLISRSL